MDQQLGGSCFVDLVSEDILRIIFDILLDFGLEFGRAPPTLSQFLLPLILSHVCRRWRDILLSPNYPSTWAHVYSTPRKFLDLYLQRSRSAELDLHLTGVGKDLIDTVILPNCDRLRQLHVFFQSGSQIPDLDFTAPRLRSLTISCPDNPRGPFTCPILSSQKLPKLSKLNVRSLFFPSNTGFTALTHLRLSYCSGSNQDLFRLLQASPNLEELILDAPVLVNGPWNNSQILDGPLSLPLPHLRWIYIYGDTSILHRLRLPPDCAIRMSTRSNDLAPLPFPILKLHLNRLHFTALGESGFALYRSNDLLNWLPRAVVAPHIFGSVQEFWLNGTLDTDCVVVFRQLPLL
jgi:hypothetical protein